MITKQDFEQWAKELGAIRTAPCRYTKGAYWGHACFASRGDAQAFVDLCHETEGIYRVERHSIAAWVEF